MSGESRATPRKSRYLKLAAGIGVVLLMGHCAHLNFVFTRAQEHARTLLGSLERYQASHGHYPGDLTELAYFTELDDSYRERITYTTYERRSEFFLSAVHPYSKEMDTYTSESGRWRLHHLRQLKTILGEGTSEH